MGANAENEETGKPAPYSLEAFYQQNGLDWGAGDLFCIGGGKLLKKLREFLRVLGAFEDDRGYTPFNQIIVVTPPDAAAPLRDYEAAINRKIDDSPIRSPAAKDKGPWLKSPSGMADEELQCTRCLTCVSRFGATFN